jgi:hypothetical protein
MDIVQGSLQPNEALGAVTSFVGVWVEVGKAQKPACMKVLQVGARSHRFA